MVGLMSGAKVTGLVVVAKLTLSPSTKLSPELILRLELFVQFRVAMLVLDFAFSI